MKFLQPKAYQAQFLFLLMCLTFALPAWSVDLAGRVILAKGQVTAVNQAGESRALKRRSKVFNGDVIKTGPNGSVQLRFVDKALMTIKANSEMDIASYQQGGNGKKEEAIMNLVKGGFRTITGQIGKGDKSAYKVSTPAASIGIRGTNYEVQQESDGGFVMAVYSGGISVQNESGTLDLGLGSDYNFVRVSSGAAPVGLLSAPESLSENAATDSSEQESEENSESSGNEESNSEGNDESSDDSEGTVAANDESGSDSSSTDQDSSEEASPIDEAISAIQSEMGDLDEGTEEVLTEVVAALDRNLINEVEEDKEILKQEVEQELVDGGFLEEGETLADLEDTVKENLENLGSLDDLIDAIDSGTDLTEPDIIPDPDGSTDPTTDPSTDPTTDPTVIDPLNFIESLYSNLTTATNPFPTNIVSQEEYNLIDSDKLAVMAMPLNYTLDVDGNPVFSFNEAQLQSPFAIDLGSFTGFDYSAPDSQTGFSVIYAMTNLDTKQTQEFEIRVNIGSNVTTIGDLELLISDALINGDVFIPGTQTTLANGGHISVFQADPGGQGTEAQFVFQPNSGSNTFITSMELQFWDEGTPASQALITQLSGSSMIGHDDWRAEVDTEMIISSGAWQIADTDGSGSPILYFEETRTENVDGNDVQFDTIEAVNKPLNVDTVGSLVSLGICADSEKVCDIAVDIVRASEKIRWGAWLAEPGEGITIYEQKEDQLGFTESDIHSEERILAFWLAAERADISSLTGTAQFSSSSNTDCTDYSQCIGFADDGIVQAVTGQFNVNFDTGAITNGNLNINVTDDPNLFSSDLGPTVSEWDVNFSGQLSTDTSGSRLPEFTTNNINGVVKDGVGNQVSNQVIGNVGGIFVKPGDVFAGGYNIGTADGTNKQTSGVFTLDKVNP